MIDKDQCLGIEVGDIAAERGEEAVMGVRLAEQRVEAGVLAGENGALRSQSRRVGECQAPLSQIFWPLIITAPSRSSRKADGSMEAMLTVVRSLK